jgi:hypothetical protein
MEGESKEQDGHENALRCTGPGAGSAPSKVQFHAPLDSRGSLNQMEALAQPYVHVF